MPPRFVIALIVGFWLLATGWLVYREWWPWLQPDSPPPFTVELADEAAPLIANWTIWRDDQRLCTSVTKMTSQKDDSFELESTIENLEVEMDAFIHKVQIKITKLRTVQKVARDGKLLAVDSKLQIHLAAVGQKFDMKAHIYGVARNGQLHAHSKIESLFGSADNDLDPIPLESGTAFNPLQPLAKLRVRPGQRWKISTVDPLEEAFYASLQQMLSQSKVAAKAGGNLRKTMAAPKMLLAEVLSEPRDLVHEGQTISCYLIEYRGEELTGQTWVQVSDGKVLRQEVTWQGKKMMLLRDD